MLSMENHALRINHLAVVLLLFCAVVICLFSVVVVVCWFVVVVVLLYSSVGLAHSCLP